MAVFRNAVKGLAPPSRPAGRRVPILPPWGATNRASALILGLSIAGAALAVGTVHTPTLCVVTLALAVAAALAWGGADAAAMRPSATLLLMTGLALTGYTALQCVPIPMALLRIVAPHNADIWSRALAPMHEPGPSWPTLSLDPNATRVEVLKGVAYLLAFTTSLRLVRRRGGISFLSTVLVVTGLALAIAAVLHPAFGAKKLYGFITPVGQIEERHLAPFLNPNNLAAYLNIAFCIAFATAISPDPRFPRSLSGSVALMLAVTQVWVASRGGVATMVLGAAAVVVLSRPRSLAGTGPRLGLSLGLLVALAGGAFLVGIGVMDKTSRLLTTDVRFKREVIHDAARMIPTYPIFGIGRGAFESVFPAFRHSIWIRTFSHPENVVLQWTVEWGLPVALAAFVAVGFALRPRTVLARSAAAVGPWAAILAVVTQNLVDLGTELPGLMLAVVVCAAIVTGGTAGRRASWRVEGWADAPTLVAATGIVAAVGAVLVPYLGLDGELFADETALFSAAKERTTTADEMRLLARASMLRHPAEPYLPFIVGWRAESARDDDPMPWLEATLERAPIYPAAHRVLADLLARRHPAQARLEYRLTLEQSPDLVWNVVPEAARLVGGFDDAMELLPPLGPVEAATTLEILVDHTDARLPATRVRLDAEIVARTPMAPEPAARAAADAVQDVEADSQTPWCEGPSHAACTARALALAKEAERLDARSCGPHALRARAEVAAGNVAAGLAALATAADQVVDRVACLQQLASIADSAHDEARWRGAVEKVASAGCTSDAECVVDLSWAAGQEEAHGKLSDALALYKRAYERAPADDDILVHVARLAATSGLHTEAAEDYERLARKQPADLRWRRAADAERGALY